MEYNNAGHAQCQATRPWWIMHGTILSLSVPVQNGDSSPFIITIIAWWFRHRQQMFLSWNSETSRCHSCCKTTFCARVHTHKYQLYECVFKHTYMHADTHTHKFTVKKQACCVSSPLASAMKIYMVVYLHVCCEYSWNINLFLKKVLFGGHSCRMYRKMSNLCLVQ